MAGSLPFTTLSLIHIFAVGNAQVSDKHCGFVINNGNATAEEVRELIRQIVERVYENSNVTLEPEVKFLGEF